MLVKVCFYILGFNTGKSFVGTVISAKSAFDDHFYLENWYKLYWESTDFSGVNFIYIGSFGGITYLHWRTLLETKSGKEIEPYQYNLCM